MASFENTDTIPSSVQMDVNHAIADFVKRYESQHGVTIVDHTLESENFIEAGRNYASGIKRLEFVYEKNKKKSHSSVVIKIPQISLSYEKFQKLRLYENERCIYEKVLPRMYECWPYEKLSPIMYAATQSGVLVLENLQESNYYMKQKNFHFDLDECKTMLKTLAQFHALSCKYLKTYGPELDSLMFSKQDESSQTLLPLLFDKIRKHVIPLLPEPQMNKWLLFEKDSRKVIMEAYSSNNENFSVLCHGDLQYNNFLFCKEKYRNIAQCKLVDFQVSRRGSPIIDLIYFSVTSLQPDVFKQNREEIFNYYTQILNSTLEELEYDQRYTLDDLNTDFMKYELFLLFVLGTIVPLMWVSSWSIDNWTERHANNLNSVIQSDEYISLFKSWMETIE